MSAMNCPACGQALALADERCPHCQAPVPVAQRLAVLLPRAEALAEQGRLSDAARALDAALNLPLSPAEAKLLWRKKGAWLRKAGHLDGAEEALASSLGLDDNDEFSHQLWIDLLVERDLAEKARLWYQQRLAMNPEDALAQKQLLVLKLAQDFKSQAPPKVPVETLFQPRGFMGRLIMPTKAKVIFIGVGGFFSVLQLAWILLRQPAAEVAIADMEGLQGIGGAASLMQVAGDPWLAAFSAALSFAYVAWGWKSFRA